MKKIIISLCFALIAATGMAQSPLTFHAKAGIGTSKFWGKYSNSETKIAYKVGAGAEYTLNRTWAVQSALEFVSIGGRDEMPGIGSARMNELYLQIPLLMSARLHLGKKYHAALSAGPYIACGIGGKTSGEQFNEHSDQGNYRFKVDTFGSMQEGNMGTKRMDAGIMLALTFEYHRFIFGADMQLGLVKVNEQINQLRGYSEGGSYLPKNFATFFNAGYRF